MVEKKSLGRYRILEELGRGAMGVVYKAEDPVLDRQLAIKTIVIPAHDADRKEYEARFTQEARAAGRLSHPGIVTIYDVGREGDVVYIAMELLEGIDLSTRANQERFPVTETVQIVEQVAEAMAFAHDRGVVHRDIKPPNIMLLPGQRAKIMDFGIARMRQSDIRTQTGMMLGTPRYMSPEQVAGRPSDHRSDIFSLGTVLYELLTGTKLFGGAEATEIMYNVANVRPVPPSRINRQVPAMLDLVVAKAQEKSVDERYQDAHELAADLRACMSELGVHRAEPASTQRLNVAATPGAGDEPTDTLPMGMDTGSVAADTAATARAPRALSIIVDANTRLGLSAIFDSSDALKRLATPEARDQARLTKSPRTRGSFAQLWRDFDLRMLSLFVLAALAAGMVVSAL
ncbi:MAG: serine/threonine-protein kinase [Burkholderiales bacterium]